MTHEALEATNATPDGLIWCTPCNMRHEPPICKRVDATSSDPQDHKCPHGNTPGTCIICWNKK